MLDCDIKLKPENDKLFDDHGLQRLKKGYMRKDEKSPQERFAYVARAFGSNPEHAQRIYNYASDLWLSFSTPLLAFGKNKKGLPVSCFLSPIHDTADSLIDTSSETRRMTVGGGGVGLYLGIREKGEKSSGLLAHMKTYDADTLAYKQAETRRGAYAAYAMVSHPEILPFIDARNPTGGDANQRTLNMHVGVNLTDDFMNRVLQLSTNKDLTREEQEALDKWPLISPEHQQIVGYSSVKEIWMKIINNRVQIGGEPYMHFIDTSNFSLPEYQKALGLRVWQSNLCTEITLPVGMDIFGKDRAAICCLSSLNLSKWHAFKDHPTFIADVVEFLDNVIQHFIDNAGRMKGYERAVYSATRERAIGIGGLGWHDLLQQENLPFASPMAVGLNMKIWKHINEQGMAANVRLAEQRGPCPDSVGSERPVRCSHLFAIAPNASSSIILATSPSIEPYRANAYAEKGTVGYFVSKNHNLEKVLEALGKNTKEVWDIIVQNDGSVQTLDFLDEWTKDVYKTAMEIDQRWIIQQAGDRQPYICQAQSVNIFFLPTASIEEIALIHLMAWRLKLKSLYYCRSATLSKAKVGKKTERINIDLEALAKSLQEDSVCVACE